MQQPHRNFLNLTSIHSVENLIKYHNLKISASTVRASFRQLDSFPVISLLDIARVLKGFHMETLGVTVQADALHQLSFPAIVPLKEAETSEFVLLTGIADGIVSYTPPNSLPVSEPIDRFCAKWENKVLMVAPSTDFAEAGYEEKIKAEISAQEAYRQGSLLEVDAFLTAEECSLLIESATHAFSSSQVLVGGMRTMSTLRKSSSATLSSLDKSLSDSINAKTAKLLEGRPYASIEPLQCVSYTTGQAFQAHFDSNQVLKRRYTILVYLNEGFEGGETYFPELNLVVKPKLGKALLFHNLDDDGNVDGRSLHAGLPVSMGIKFAANIWVH